jgi:hypothetical protein
LIVGIATNRSRDYPEVTDNQLMVSCRPTPWWTLQLWIGTVIVTGGGVIMLTTAAAIHGSPSVPLLVFGGGWFLMGLAGVWQLRHQVREIVLDGETVEFRCPARDIVIPAQEITEIRWPRWDPGARASYDSGLTQTGSSRRHAGWRVCVNL